MHFVDSTSPFPCELTCDKNESTGGGGKWVVHKNDNNINTIIDLL